MTSTSTDRRQGVNSNAAIKVPCRVATTANITLSGLQTIDGVTVVEGDRVLVKNQTSGVDNGIYVADTSDWERALDWDGYYDVKTGTLVKVNFGSTNGGFWYVTTTGNIIVGTTSVTIAVASSILAVISAFVQTLLDDADGSAFLTTLYNNLAAETTPATDDAIFIKDTSGGTFDSMTVANFLKIINALTAETAPATDDLLALYDTSAGTVDKITLENFLKVINSLTQDSSPDAAADFLVTYDTSASLPKKVLPNALGASTSETKGGTSTKFVTPASLLGAIGFSSQFVSTAQTISAGGALTIAHGLGRTPYFILAILKNTSTEGGFSANDETPTTIGDSQVTTRGCCVVPDATNLNIRFGSEAGFSIVRKDTGGQIAIDVSKWTIRFMAFG